MYFVQEYKIFTVENMYLSGNLEDSNWMEKMHRASQSWCSKIIFIVNLTSEVHVVAKEHYQITLFIYIHSTLQWINEPCVKILIVPNLLTNTTKYL